MKNNTKKLIKIGFNMSSDNFGTIDPEYYDVGKDHFKPKYRTVYISTAMYPKTPKNFYYITSDLHGEFRGYRKHYWYDSGLGNIFVSGKTRDIAINKFIYNYTNKIYNVKK